MIYKAAWRFFSEPGTPPRINQRFLRHFKSPDCAAFRGALNGLFSFISQGGIRPGSGAIVRQGDSFHMR
jgi:hypothetical protein